MTRDEARRIAANIAKLSGAVESGYDLGLVRPTGLRKSSAWAPPSSEYV
jgi:hypothetical protein